MIGYSGNSNNQTIASLSNSFGGSNFTNYLSQYNLVVSFISWIIFDNIIAPLFAGIMIVKLGARITMLVFLFITLLG